MGPRARPLMRAAAIGFGVFAAAAAAGAAMLAAQSQAPPNQAQAPPAQTPATPQGPVFRAGANLVTVDAYPLRNGRIVEGLQASDFTILEDGKPQTIAGFEFLRIEPTPTEAQQDPNTIDEARRLAADPHNRVFVAFLDTHHVRLAGGFYANKPLVDVLNRVLAPNDLFGVMTPAMRPSDIALGRKTMTVASELTKYWSWGRRGSTKILPSGELAQRCYTQPPGGAGDQIVDPTPVFPIPFEIVARSWEDESLSALENLSRYLGTVREARSAVIVLSDGWQEFTPNEALLNQIVSANQQDPRTQGQLPGILVGPGGRLGLPGTGSGGASGAQDAATCLTEVSRLARLDDTHRIHDIVAAATRTNVTFYTVNPDGLIVSDSLIGDPEESDLMTQQQRAAAVQKYGAAQVAGGETTADFDRQLNRLNGLKELADNTNGLAVVNTNDIASGLRRIVDEVSAYYLLGYYSTNTKVDGTYRRIDVKIDQPDVRVASRRGYTATRTLPASASPAISTGLDRAFSALANLRPDAELYVDGAVVADGLQVAVEIPARAASVWADGGQVSVTVATNAGGATAPVSGTLAAGTYGARLIVPLATLGPGPWRATAVVHGSAGRLEGVTEISTPNGSFVGGALVFRGTPSGHSLLRPVADREFYRIERIHVEWPELQALDQRRARLLGKNGQPIAVNIALTERDENGHPTLAADLVLGPLAAADYVIDLTVGAAGKTEEQLVPFRVIQ